MKELYMLVIGAIFTQDTCTVSSQLPNMPIVHWPLSTVHSPLSFVLWPCPKSSVHSPLYTVLCLCLLSTVYCLSGSIWFVSVLKE